MSENVRCRSPRRRGGRPISSSAWPRERAASSARSSRAARPARLRTPRRRRRAAPRHWRERSSRATLPAAPIACADGCSACCYSKIVAVAPEVLRIAAHLRSTLAPDALAALVDRVRDTDARTRGLGRDDRAAARVPCPLLLKEAAPSTRSARSCAADGRRSTGPRASVISRRLIASPCRPGTRSRTSSRTRSSRGSARRASTRGSTGARSSSWPRCGSRSSGRTRRSAGSRGSRCSRERATQSRAAPRIRTIPDSGGRWKAAARGCRRRALGVEGACIHGVARPTRRGPLGDLSRRRSRRSRRSPSRAAPRGGPAPQASARRRSSSSPRSTTRDVAVEVRAPVELRPLAQADVGSKTLGYLDAVLVDRGDRVKRGQLLALVRPSDLPDQLVAARGTLAQAQASAQPRAQATSSARSSSRPSGVVSQQELQQSQAALATAEAQEAAAKAQVGAHRDAPRRDAHRVAARRRRVGASPRSRARSSGRPRGGAILTVARVDVLRVFVTVNERDVHRASSWARRRTSRSTRSPGKSFKGKVVRLAPDARPRHAHARRRGADRQRRRRARARACTAAAPSSSTITRSAPVAPATRRADHRPASATSFVLEGRQGRAARGHGRRRRRRLARGHQGRRSPGEEVVTAGIDALSDGSTVRAVAQRRPVHGQGAGRGGRGARRARPRAASARRPPHVAHPARAPQPRPHPDDVADGARARRACRYARASASTSSPTSTSRSSASPPSTQAPAPRTSRRRITQPIERAVAPSPGVDRVESTSKQGVSVVSVWFNYGVNLDNAQFEVQQRVAQILSTLPPGIQQPFILKFDITNIPVVAGRRSPARASTRSSSTTSPTTSSSRSSSASPASRAPRSSGGKMREIEVKVDRDALRARGLGILDVVNAVQGREPAPAERATCAPATATTTSSPTPRSSTARRARGRRRRARARRRAGTTGASRVGARRRRRRASSTAPPTRPRSCASTARAACTCACSSSRAPTPSPSSTRVRAGAPEPARRPAERQAARSPSTSRRTSARRSASLEHEARPGRPARGAVILVFLVSLRATGIVAVAIPLSIIATFVLLYFSGQTLNVFTLGGLALGVGRLVDDSIVELENIHRHLAAHGRPRARPCSTAAQEVAMPILVSHDHHRRRLLPGALPRGRREEPLPAAGADHRLRAGDELLRVAHGDAAPLPLHGCAAAHGTRSGGFALRSSRVARPASTTRYAAVARRSCCGTARSTIGVILGAVRRVARCCSRLHRHRVLPRLRRAPVQRHLQDAHRHARRADRARGEADRGHHDARARPTARTVALHDDALATAASRAGAPRSSRPTRGRTPATSR